MATTPNLNITLVEQAQSQKEVTMNEAITILDAAVGGGVIDKDLATPPGSPSAGDRYIVAASPTGAWTGHAKDIAYYFDGGWRFLTPGEGLFVWVNDEDVLYVYDGTNWTSSVAGSLTATKLGINATADTTNRLAVASPAILFNRETDDIQVKVNKQAAGDTASFLFQTGTSGRAEIGLIGDDDFRFKVSPDGSTFYTAFILDKDNGNASFQKFIGLADATELTIATGAITATQSYHKIDTEADAGTDDLDSISGGTSGDILILKAENAARTVVLKDGTGNLVLEGDCSLDNTEDRIMLHKDGANWVELSRSNNGA